MSPLFTYAGLMAFLPNFLLIGMDHSLSSEEATLEYQPAFLHSSRALSCGTLPSRSLKRPESALLKSRAVILLSKTYARLSEKAGTNASNNLNKKQIT